MAKISNRFREYKGEQLEKEVRKMTSEQKQHYLEEVATIYLAVGSNLDRLTASDYEKIMEEKGDYEISF